MTKSKNPEPNPIEEAIGERAKTTKDIPRIVDSKQFQKLAETPDEPSPSEMLTLEELNRQTEERLRDEPEKPTKVSYDPIPQRATIATPPENEMGVATPLETPTPVLIQESPIPVSKPDPQPVTKTSSQESPPQKIDTGQLAKHINDPSEKCPDCGVCNDDDLKEALTTIHEAVKTPPAEDIEFSALKKYIQEDGFVLATVAFHIVTLCAQPMVTPSTTTWDFRDRASVPDMVLALLNQPGYLEGIWPSLAVVMGSNKGNAAWCAGIATTIAFFDVVRTLPAIKELQIDVDK